MDRNKKTAIIYYVTAVVFYICAIIWICEKNTSLGAVWLCIGSTNLCLGSVWMKRSGDEQEQNKKEEDKSED